MLVGVSSVSFGAVYITIISIINFHHSLNGVQIWEKYIALEWSVSNWQRQSCRTATRKRWCCKCIGVSRVVITLQIIWGTGLWLLGRAFLVTRNLPSPPLNLEWMSGFKVREEMLLTLESPKSGFGWQAVWKCVCILSIFCSPRERNFSVPVRPYETTLGAIKVLDYTTGNELQKEKQYTSFSIFKWDIGLLLTSRSIS